MLHSLRQGLGHLAAAPTLLLLIWLVNLLVALPAAVLVGEAIHESIEWSRAHESLRTGFDTGWYGEFAAQAKGLAASFEPGQIGVGGVLDVLDRWWKGGLFELQASIVAMGVVYALVWLFLLGGVLGRLHRPWGRCRGGEFFATGRTYFFPFARLAVMASIAYYGIFRLAAWLFPWIDSVTRDLTSEKRILLFNLAAGVLIVGLLTLVRAIFDYARIAMVVGGQRSAIASSFAGLEFVFRRPVATGGLVLVFGIFTLVLVAAYGKLSLGAGAASVTAILLAIAGSQVFFLCRLALRLGLLSCQIAFFERRGDLR